MRRTAMNSNYNERSRSSYFGILSFPIKLPRDFNYGGLFWMTLHTPRCEGCTMSRHVRHKTNCILDCMLAHYVAYIYITETQILFITRIVYALFSGQREARIVHAKYVHYAKFMPIITIRLDTRIWYFGIYLDGDSGYWDPRKRTAYPCYRLLGSTDTWAPRYRRT